MCGRALEGVCAAFKTKKEHLAGGLDELLQKEIIDKKIYQWGQETRRLRNVAAHASSETISAEDADDLIEFTKAICVYVFVMTAKFKQFMDRAEKLRQRSSANSPPTPKPPPRPEKE
jgi:hypothetical protein